MNPRKEVKDTEPKEVPEWASRAWQEVASPLRAKFGEPAYATWLATAAVVEAADNDLTLGVPLRLQRDHITNDYLAEIEGLLAAQLGRAVSVSVVVSSHLELVTDEQAPGTEIVDGDAVRLNLAVIRRENTGHPRVLGRIENNLARKAFFDLQASREHDQVEVERQDLVGTTALVYTLGRLGALEMDVCTWALGRWKRGDKKLRFSKRELARDMGLSWGGKTGAELTRALLRLRNTSVKGEVWLAETGHYIFRDLSLFQELTIDEHRESRDGHAVAPGHVELVLSDWLHGQLQRGQYASLDFETYRHDITTPFARRLYHILECEEGTEGGTRVEFRIDHIFMSTMGSRDSNIGRFRARLADSGAIVCRARPHYLSISVAVDKRGVATLRVTRSPDWQRQRLAWRQAENRMGWRGSRGEVVDEVARTVDGAKRGEAEAGATSPPALEASR